MKIFITLRNSLNYLMCGARFVLCGELPADSSVRMDTLLYLHNYLSVGVVLTILKDTDTQILYLGEELGEK